MKRMWSGGKISRRLRRELAGLLIDFGCKALGRLPHADAPLPLALSIVVASTSEVAARMIYRAFLPFVPGAVRTQPVVFGR